ncbi:MAG: hypothetical protein HZC28_16325 [Spirochaetes bacterium]|nr:hypothetical protein [Spirochaetota bacterium]
MTLISCISIQPSIESKYMQIYEAFANKTNKDYHTQQAYFCSNISDMTGEIKNVFIEMSNIYYNNNNVISNYQYITVYSNKYGILQVNNERFRSFFGAEDDSYIIGSSKLLSRKNKTEIYFTAVIYTPIAINSNFNSNDGLMMNYYCEDAVMIKYFKNDTNLDIFYYSPTADFKYIYSKCIYDTNRINYIQFINSKIIKRNKSPQQAAGAVK